LGKFILDGLPPAPRGVPQIEVAFDIDADGILHVNAQDKATGREQKITITASSGLNDEEIKRMVEQAEQHRQDDSRRKEEVEVRNHADNLIYSAEKTLRDLGDKVPAGVKSEVEQKVTAVRNALSSSDVARLKQSSDELAAAIQKIGASAYEQPAAGSAPTSGESGEPGGDRKPPEGDVVDGDYREA
jgi:molecular chaperone DnaK